MPFASSIKLTRAPGAQVSKKRTTTRMMIKSHKFPMSDGMMHRRRRLISKQAKL